MKNEAQSHNRDSEARNPRFRFGLFLAAEVICTGALVVWVVLDM
jgi:hypothetical protein